MTQENTSAENSKDANHPPELIEIVEIVSERHLVNHAFSEGIVAQAGVEW